MTNITWRRYKLLLFILLNLLDCSYSFVKENGFSSFGVAPHWSDHCAVLSTIPAKRSIPRLSDDVMHMKPSILQVHVFSRHGARTPTSYHANCWKGYKPVWNCNQTETIMWTSNKMATSNLYSFDKRFDADVNSNVFKGTCRVGQLIEDGAEQLRAIGKLLAAAYFNVGDNISPGNILPVPLLNFTDHRMNNQNLRNINFRSTDYQRTFASGINLVASMLDQISTHLQNDNAGDLAAAAAEFLPIHTVDAVSDYLYPQWNLPIMQRYMSVLNGTKQFNALKKANLPFVQNLSNILGVDLINDGVWGDTLMDCLITSACSSVHKSDLHTAFKDDELLQETYVRSSREASYYVTFHKDIISKVSAMRMIRKIRFDMLRMLCSKCRSIADIDKLIVSYDLPSLSASTKDDILSSISASQIKRFSYWSGHDLTLSSLMAALNVFDGWWPPYASLFIIELYETAVDKQTWLRLIYNSKDVTHRLFGCPAQGLCPISKFLKNTSWAETKHIEKAILQASWIPFDWHIKAYWLLLLPILVLAIFASYRRWRQPFSKHLLRQLLGRVNTAKKYRRTSSDANAVPDSIEVRSVVSSAVI